MPRLIVLLLAGALLYRFVKQYLSRPPARPPAADTSQASPLPMTACVHCGVHVPVADAIRSSDGRTYCCEAHRPVAHAEPV